MSLTAGSITDRLQKAADRPTGVRFVGPSVTPADGPDFVSWAEIHDDARAVGAATLAEYPGAADLMEDVELSAAAVGDGREAPRIGPSSRESRQPVAVR